MIKMLFEIPDKAYILIPKNQVKIEKIRKGRVRIKLSDREVNGKRVRINKELSIIRIRRKGHKYYIIDNKLKNEYLFFRDDERKPRDLIYGGILKNIAKRLEFSERIERIKRVSLEKDYYVFYFNKEKKFFVDEIPKTYSLKIGGKMTTFIAFLSCDRAKVSIRELNELLFKKIKGRYMQAKLVEIQTVAV